MRANAEHPVSRRTIPGDERTHGVFVDLEIQDPQFTGEVVQGIAILRRVGIAPDGLVRARIARSGKGLDVALYAFRALLTVY